MKLIPLLLFVGMLAVIGCSKQNKAEPGAKPQKVRHSLLAFDTEGLACIETQLKDGITISDPFTGIACWEESWGRAEVTYVDGVAKDEKEAVKWYTKAAEQGDAVGQRLLGWCYLNGTGVAKDEKEAVKWFTKSAEQGDAEAQYNLGMCYDLGKGVTQDRKEAVKWLTKSAKQKDAIAKEELEKLKSK